MDKKSLSLRLRELAEDTKRRSKAAQLRDVIDDVEHALSHGVKQADVLAELRRAGLVMTLATFNGTLRRIRAKRIKEPAPPRTKNPAAKEPTPVRTDAESRPTATGQSHNPAVLDQIAASTPNLDALTKAGRKAKR